MAYLGIDKPPVADLADGPLGEFQDSTPSLTLVRPRGSNLSSGQISGKSVLVVAGARLLVSLSQDGSRASWTFDLDLTVFADVGLKRSVEVLFASYDSA